MERNIPLYSYEGKLEAWIDLKRLDRLVEIGRIRRVIRHTKGRVARAILRRMPGEPRPSAIEDYTGTNYCFRQRLQSGQRCFRLRSLGDPRADERNLAPDEVRRIFMAVVLDCLV